jgi:DNA-binding CsgD family transcriptional regulator
VGFSDFLEKSGGKRCGADFPTPFPRRISMKKSLAFAAVLMLSVIFFSACGNGSEKTAEITIIYGIAFLISLALVVGYTIFAKRKDVWFSVLFVSVAVVNFGYLLLSMSETLGVALWANRIAYLGSVFLPMSMLFIILGVVKINYTKSLLISLSVVGVVVFLIAGSPGVLDIYYKEVTLVRENGFSVLDKVYGPLHRVYLVYLLGYFGAMIYITTKAISKDKLLSPVHSMILLSAVFINIVVWLIEQFIKVDFEILSISYIITELFLLGIRLLIEEHERQFDASKERAVEEETVLIPKNVAERFKKNLASLTPTEKVIYNLYVQGKGTKEVLAELCISENTLKFHNKNIYGKLQVSSRKELLQIASGIKE